MTEAARFQQQLDTRAIEMATKALDRVETHERYCAERYEGIKDSLGKIEDGVQSVHDRISRQKDAISTKVFGLTTTVIGALVAAVMYLFLHGSPLQ